MSVSVEQQRTRSLPLSLVIDCWAPPHTESVPDFLTNLRLSDLYNLPGVSVPMNPKIFSAMRAGNIYLLENMKTSVTPMTCLKNDKGDSVLHLAAALGHDELVERIISECPSLLLEQNWKDQIPIHAAAYAGHLDVVKTLVASIAYFSGKILSEEERERFNVYVLKDIDGDTPLHAALKGGHLETALCLVKANHLASFLQNNAGISPLYMAVEAGGLALVKEMLNSLSRNVQGQESNLASRFEGRKSLVHAALKAKNTDILNVILHEDPSLGDEKDEEGRTCLSVGAFVGFREGVCNLLDRSTSSVFECNGDGSFPIHMAVEKGHMDVLVEMIIRCPDLIELLNKQGQNILHIAAKSGGYGHLTIIELMKRLYRENNHLIEEQDEDGNTPLHLATINWRPRMVRDLTKYPSNATRLLKIQNKDGLRALDIAELNLQSNYIFRERMTLMVLLSAYKPKGYDRIPPSGMTLRSRSELADPNKYKDRVNALLVVATLIATITFAAGITLPGGLNSSGKAILATESKYDMFVGFMLFDIIAMVSSIIAIIALLWAQMGDPELVHKAFRLALPSLSMALTSMTLAFQCGVMLTTSGNRFILYFIGMIQIPFFFVFVLVLVPYVGQEYGRQFGRSMDMCLWILLALVTEDDAETYHNSGSCQTRGL
ncbi:unnamed protein product [Microthlaspi erraticum]|uniref:PGG domain-containing protein n=1 Tax=Microthlaspi erraticum TaxID=1685480 RepID=A0A6D2K194_9BRAS|nr:unnamed protein product [Microthlaspi erraticum]